MSDVPRGINPEPLTEWLSENLPGSAAPYQWDLVAAGASNLSYVLSDAKGQRWVMRRGPESERLSKAHDMGREWRVISAMASAEGVPVPSCMAFCEDPDVNGSEFYIMSLVEGEVMRTTDITKKLSAERCLHITDSLVGVQAAIHKADIHKIGLSEFSKTHDKYVQRQLHRWHKQVNAADDEPPALLSKVWEQLLEKDPGEQAPPALVHGDYRLDNVVINDKDEVAGVLDWELSTIGDPVADFFWSLSYWSRKGDPVRFIPDSPTLHDAFPEKEELIKTYQKHTGFDMSAKNYFMAFSCWKMACIAYGVVYRMRRGAGGGMAASTAESMNDMIDNILAAADEMIAAF